MAFHPMAQPTLNASNDERKHKKKPQQAAVFFICDALIIYEPLANQASSKDTQQYP